MGLTNSFSPRQRLIFWSLTVLCGASRFLAMARSMWDWDEALFSLGMRGYDVTMHHPHPPGFPVYIGMARLVRLVTSSDFRALQAVNLIAGVLVFPALFLLARELELRFETSAIAAALFAFFPNVWFFGGAAFSDVPSIVLVIFAAVFLLRGRQSARAYHVGTLLLALAIGIRPQNILIGLFPGLLATRRRSARDIIVALLIGVIVVGASYGAAIYATGTWDGYMKTVRAHSDYISRIDSFRAPSRPPLWRLFDRFFIKQYQSPPLSVLVSFLVAISIVGAIRGRDRKMLGNFLIFGPFAITAWLMLDRFSINRFSIGYAPMFAIFAADGIERMARGSRAVESAIGAFVVACFVVWTLPAFTPVRRDVAPSVQAVQAAVKAVKTSGGRLLVGYSMTPFLEYLAPSLEFTRVIDDRAIPMGASDRALLLAEVSSPYPGGTLPLPGRGTLFARDRDRLWNITRRHYFEVSLKPVTNVAQFGAGWYQPEQGGMDEFRWMGAQSVTTLPGASGPTMLRLNLSIPGELVARHPTITVTLNGKTLERFRATESEVWRDDHVTPLPASNLLEISTDQTIKEPGSNPRDLGMSVRFIAWGPG
jgi:hypothetical protein